VVLYGRTGGVTKVVLGARLELLMQAPRISPPMEAAITLSGGVQIRRELRLGRVADGLRANWGRQHIIRFTPYAWLGYEMVPRCVRPPRCKLAYAIRFTLTGILMRHSPTPPPAQHHHQQRAQARVAPAPHHTHASLPIDSGRPAAGCTQYRVGRMSGAFDAGRATLRCQRCSRRGRGAS
jgi:hypothetical protein